MTDIANGLIPAREVAARDTSRIPNESPEYRRARTALLAEEIELRRNIERVAAMRRALPPGAPIEKDYVFEGENGAVHFPDLFGHHSTLIVYNYMFGPERQRPCPMCTALLGGIAGNAIDIQQRAALAVVARSPIEKLQDFKRERGWWHLPLYSDMTEEFGRDFGAWTKDGDHPAYNVFTKRDGTIRHFWGGEMGGVTADPGQDPRGAPDLTPLWNVLDTTPEGRDPNWYPKVDYN